MINRPISPKTYFGTPVYFPNSILIEILLDIYKSYTPNSLHPPICYTTSLLHPTLPLNLLHPKIHYTHIFSRAIVAAAAAAVLMFRHGNKATRYVWSGWVQIADLIWDFRFERSEPSDIQTPIKLSEVTCNLGNQVTRSNRKECGVRNFDITA